MPVPEVMPPTRTPRVRLALRRFEHAIFWQWLRGYERGWDEALDISASGLEHLLEKADGPHIPKADVRALALRLRREAEH